MDLLQTVRKEGSRGGRGDFKWSDVQSSSHRENYLGHSLMAPVGRWQKNKDLSWYSKGDAEDGEDAETRAAAARKEEIRLIKQAEEDALARALGYEVPVRPAPGTENPNLTALGGSKGLKKAVEQSVLEEESARHEDTKGLGYGRQSDSYRRGGGAGGDGADNEIMNGSRGNAVGGLRSEHDVPRERKHRHRRRRSRSPSRSRSRSRSRTRRHSRERDRDRRKPEIKYSDRRTGDRRDTHDDRAGVRDRDRDLDRESGRNHERNHTRRRHRDERTASPSPHRRRDRSRDRSRDRTSRGDPARKPRRYSREDEQQYHSDRRWRDRRDDR